MKDMLGREEVLSVYSAREALLKSEGFALPGVNELDIDSSLNRILAADILSPEDLPGFSRSTMDGFAVRSTDTFGAKDTMPAYLNIKGEVLMGKQPEFEIKKGEAAKIATGGMLPAGTDAVVMFEHSSFAGSNLLEVLKSVAPGDNTIQAGEDCTKGEKVLIKGHRVRPQDIGALAGIGITKVHVYEKPVVAIIGTGDEVVTSSVKLLPGQVRDINSHSLAALVELYGGTAIQKGIYKDNYEVLKRVFDDSLKEADIVAITGGSSVGTKDMTSKVINSSGKPDVFFHGVSVKPGKPTIGAIVKGKPVFGLPGHPAAIIVCFDLFIKPVLKILTGETDKFHHVIKRLVKARLMKNVSSTAGREDHIRVRLEEKDGEFLAIPVLGKSGLITTLVKADGTVIIPLKNTGLEKDTEVDVELF